ncbi:hypothetical protein P7K49_021181 [Saguinus oedipus]|uniref:Glycoside hydrolase 35 catalytic domain-containing protein n=1 Tax=Saguinus oedipus TaxID=9490 RepID=A0ABQ9UTN7_SAGOE|nr:hypothetical protein P7K49_021181 [Saguinus oedipus]
MGEADDVDPSRAFVLMASEIGLWVILRPGPYICSEIDLGGLPSALEVEAGVSFQIPQVYENGLKVSRGTDPSRTPECYGTVRQLGRCAVSQAAEPTPSSPCLSISDPEPAPLTPSWLLQDPRVLLRTTNKGFIEAVEKYFDHLIPRVIPLQVKPNYLLHLSYGHFRERVCFGLVTKEPHAVSMSK